MVYMNSCTKGKDMRNPRARAVPFWAAPQKPLQRFGLVMKYHL